MRLSKESCPRCKSPLEPSESFSGGPCKTWYNCTQCNTFVHTYMPQSHQRDFHRDIHRVLGNFGGYGTGKTTTSQEDLIKHILITPGANVVVGANVSRQYKQTLKRSLELDIPIAFIKSTSVQEQTMDFINGARLMWASFDDPGKLRSLNLSYALILEGSEVNYEVFVELTSRLRSLSSGIPLLDEEGKQVYETLPNGDQIPAMKVNWRKLIVESNPDAGWIRNEILLRSHKIIQHGVEYKYDQNPERIIPNTSSHVASSRVNSYLPKGWEAEQRSRYPEWWQARYLDGSFQYSEGLVYPNASTVVVEPFDIPRTWKRMVAFDYGLSDLAAFIFAAIDPVTGKVYIYKEAAARNLDIAQLSHMYKLHSADIPSGGLHTSPIIDPKSGAKRDYHKKSLTDLFLDYGISFQPGVISVDTRIMRVNTYINQGFVHIFNTCSGLIEEITDYKFTERQSKDGFRVVSVPKDANNHHINAFEWILAYLPADPRFVLKGVYDKAGMSVHEEAQKARIIPWQFQDDPEERSNGSWY